MVEESSCAADLDFRSHSLCSGDCCFFYFSGTSCLFPSGFNIFNVLCVVTLSQSQIMLFEMAHVSYANTTKALKFFGHADWSNAEISI